MEVCLDTTRATRTVARIIEGGAPRAYVSKWRVLRNPLSGKGGHDAMKVLLPPTSSPAGAQEPLA